MYYVLPDRWRQHLLSAGHERYLIERWISQVSGGGNSYLDGPIFSEPYVLQHIVQLLPLVDAGIVSQTSLRIAAAEAVKRLRNGWSARLWPGEIQSLTPMLQKIASGQQADAGLLTALALRIPTFLQTIQQRGYVRAVFSTLIFDVEDPAARFDVIDSGLDEILAHAEGLGLTTTYLETWGLRNLVGRSDENSRYHDRLRLIADVVEREERPHQVLLGASVPLALQGAHPVEFLNAAAAQGLVLAGDDDIRSRLWSNYARFALVTVSEAREPFEALQLGRATLERFVNSPDRWTSAPREISPYGLVLEDGETYWKGCIARSAVPRMTNAPLLREVRAGVHNARTADALDQVLYWYEDGWRAVGAPRIVSWWTALEFLFSLAGQSAVANITKYMPAYLTLYMLRSTLNSYCTLLAYYRNFLDPAIVASLSGATGRFDPYRVITACSDNTQDIAGSVKASTALGHRLALHFGVRRPESRGDVIKADIDSMTESVAYDVNTLYRARNAIVHRAVTDYSRSSALGAKLDFYLSTSLNQILYYFRSNPQTDLDQFHEAFLASAEQLVSRLGESSRRDSWFIHPRVLYLAAP